MSSQKQPKPPQVSPFHNHHPHSQQNYYMDQLQLNYAYSHQQKHLPTPQYPHQPQPYCQQLGVGYGQPRGQFGW